MDGRIAEQFIESAEWLEVLAGQIRPGQWDLAGLGAWDVRSLLGHAMRALSTVEEYVSRPAHEVALGSAVEYLSRGGTADPTAIAARGRQGGDELGIDPPARVTALVARAVDVVRATSGDALVTTAFGGMTLATYLPTRTLELIVHGCDLAAAIGVTADPPGDAAASTITLLSQVQVAQGHTAALCRALAGRPTAPGDLVLWPSAPST